jgi:TrmH family RNA methyltransferase
MVSKSELKFIRSLKIKKYRTGEQRFLVEGEKNVLELLSSDFVVDKLFVSPQFLEKHRNECASVHYSVVSGRDLAAMSSLVTNEQALAIVKMKDYAGEQLNTSGILIGLDGINDPGNLGTIIRTMDWFGLHHLVCSEDTVDFYNPKVISATMGSFTRVHVVYTDLSAFLKSYGGLKVSAEMNGSPLEAFNPVKPMIMVMGSESHGVRAQVQPLLDARVTISKFGQAESLNVGIATGIICHHLVTATT